ncbi:hypothetical protein [Pyrobaculum aerophilum]|uniref:hypothetical protein n=1 Tax=Pyrobaculum aerophilum TaxID=13773 RepID=UPI002FD9C71A
MKWVIELALSAVVVGFVFYVLSVNLPWPSYIASEREVTANAYFVLLRLSADPGFMALVENATCSGDQRAVDAIRTALDAMLPVRYYYNFTVYLDDVRPPTCRVCSSWGSKLASMARPWGYSPSGASVATVSALLSDGTRVRLTLSLERP